MTGSRPRRFARAVGRTALYLSAALIILAGVGLAALESGWGKNQLRGLIVSQANRFLTGTLEIDRVDGSLLRGIDLEGVRLAQDGVPVVTIERASVAYSIRELFESGTVIRRLSLHQLRVVGAKNAAGRWNLAALVRPRPPRPPGQTGPGRLITFQRIEITDGDVELRAPLAFGAAHVPTRFEHLQATFAFELQGSAWRLDFDRASWRGHAPELPMDRLAGVIATGPEGWTFEGLQVQTPRTAFTLDGRIQRAQPPTTLDLSVKADRFAFQEWGGIITGLRNIAIESAFSTRLKGPLDRMATDLDLRSNGGSIRGAFVLDSTVPGWHGAGAVEISRLDLAPWLNRPDRPSDITGRVEFDLALELGRHFPRGTYAFAGAHAAYLGYEADDLRVRGEITRKEAILSGATATAYGANVRVETGAIGIDAPYTYRFAGLANGVDLRRLPPQVPVPHVESTLVLGYDVHGQFADGFIVGSATFGDSAFLGAQIADGTVGSIDTSVTPFTYTGSGDVSAISLARFGDGLDVAWMRDPRYDGIIAGRFHVEGAGADAATMTLRGGGRLAHAEMFQGRLLDADVSVDIANGSLTGAYDGRVERVNPARALDDARFVASLTGSGRATITARDLLTRETTLDDYTIDAAVTLGPSTLRDVAVDHAEVVARLAGQALAVERFSMAGPLLEAVGHGTIELDDVRSSQFDYDVRRGDLALLAPYAGRPVSGVISTVGRLTGQWHAPRYTGNARVSQAVVADVEILTAALDYDGTTPLEDPRQSIIRVSGTLGPLTAADQAINQISGAATYDREQVTADLRGMRAGGLNAALATEFRLHAAERALDVSRVALVVQNVSWRLASGASPRLTWNGAGVTIDDLTLTDADGGQQRITLSGTWRQDGQGALRVLADGVYIDTFSGAFAQPARYGGRLDADATIRPANGGGATIVTGTFTVTDGRVRRLSFQRLQARVGYADGVFDVDGRLDQAPGVWLTALGTVPLGFFVDAAPERSMNVAIRSSPIDLAIIEGVTDVVGDVSGRLQLDVTAIGTGKDPHFDGSVDVSEAGFAVRTTGVRYRNSRLSVRFARDRVDVQALHVEDGRGRSLDVTGSLGTHEMRVGDLAIDASAHQFEVLRNEFGTTEIDAALNLRGQFESPRLTGAITITGGQLNVDAILDRTLLHPYSTEAESQPAPSSGAPAQEIDALVALNPWDRMGLDISVASRGTLKMVGENVQVSPGTPLGLGNVNVRAFGELYLYKDPAQPLFVTGSLDSLIGTYAFQGRRFDLDPDSSIVFRGDLNPELYVTVRRTISGVETRVSIVGPLNEPELRLASTPPLDNSDILSLIVFNTSINQLSASQQQELAVRAGTLAAGFLATPLVSALERSLGLDILEIEPSGSFGTGPRVTIGDEIAPGLVARFSRQFGSEEYSEATLEYFLSRIFRIRATFSDAGALLSRSPFRRVERAGIDFQLFFSF
jgi:hypothetical protein